MNILILHNKDISEQGGIANYICGLSRQLVRLGNRVDIVCVTHDRNLKDSELMDGIHVHRLYVPFSRGYVGYIFRYILLNIFLVKLHKKINFNLIGLHTAIMFSTLKHNKTLKRVPLVYTLHMSTYVEASYEFRRLLKVLPLYKKITTALKFPLVNFVYRKNEKAVLRKSEVIVVTTEYVKSILEQTHGEQYMQKVAIIPPGVESKHFEDLINKKNSTQARLELKMNEKDVIFFILRRLSPRMGLENLINAIFIVKEKMNNISKLQFLIGGKGILEGRIRSQIEDLGLSENIKLLGFISEEKKDSYLQASDCAIVPTEGLEGFGIFTVEALASGLPVIGTPIGGTIEILSNVHGGELLTDNTSPEAIADKIIYFLNNISKFTDSVNYHNLVKQRYSWDKIAVAVNEVYKKAAL